MTHNLDLSSISQSIDTLVSKTTVQNKLINKTITDHDKKNESAKVYAFIHGMVAQLTFDTNNVAIIGRFNNRSTLAHEIDLSSFGAREYGVSRLHCKLELQRDDFYATDLDSSNGTYIEGVRLTPHKPYQMEIGQIIMLARLPLKIILVQ